MIDPHEIREQLAEGVRYYGDLASNSMPDVNHPDLFQAIRESMLFESNLSERMDALVKNYSRTEDLVELGGRESHLMQQRFLHALSLVDLMTEGPGGWTPALTFDSKAIRPQVFEFLLLDYWHSCGVSRSLVESFRPLIDNNQP